MVDLHDSLTGEPPASGDRRHDPPEIHRLTLRETAVIAVDVSPDDLADAIATAIPEVERAMREAGVALAGPPFARYLASGARIRAEIGFPVLRPAPHIGRVFPGRLPGGRAASIIHDGPYDGLERTYAELQRWLAELGLRPAGPMWELYWTGPDTDPDPAAWRTEIFAPIE